MGTDKSDFTRTMPGFPMYYDKDMNFGKDRAFWLKVILLMMFSTYGIRKLNVEKDRARMTARMNGYKDMPAHWFHNRGGVVVLKDFIGFEKYYQDANA